MPKISVQLSFRFPAFERQKVRLTTPPTHRCRLLFRREYADIRLTAFGLLQNLYETITDSATLEGTAAVFPETIWCESPDQ